MTKKSHPIRPRPTERERAVPALVAVALLGGCGTDPEPREPLPPLTLEVEAGHLSADKASMKWLVAGDTVQLFMLPRGTRASIGARVKGSRTKDAEFRAQLRHPTTSAIESEEARTVNMVETSPDYATATSSISRGGSTSPSSSRQTGPALVRCRCR